MQSDQIIACPICAIGHPLLRQGATIILDCPRMPRELFLQWDQRTTPPDTL